MPVTRIRELYVAELSEVYASEEEILRHLPLMSACARDSALREILDDHYRETQSHLRRLEIIFAELDERRRHSSAPAIRGLIEEARQRQALLEGGVILDLAVIDAGRRIEHYEIAAYTAVAGYANRLGHRDAAELLLKTLDEERRADRRLELLPASTHQTAA